MDLNRLILLKNYTPSKAHVFQSNLMHIYIMLFFSITGGRRYMTNIGYLSSPRFVTHFLLTHCVQNVVMLVLLKEINKNTLKKKFLI